MSTKRFASALLFVVLVTLPLSAQPQKQDGPSMFVRLVMKLRAVVQDMPMISVPNP
jgi:hypothetical protein